MTDKGAISLKQSIVVKSLSNKRPFRHGRLSEINMDDKYKNRAVGKVVRKGKPTMYVTRTGGWFADVDELLRDEKVQRSIKAAVSLVSEKKKTGSS